MSAVGLELVFNCISITVRNIEAVDWAYFEILFQTVCRIARPPTSRRA